MRPARAASVLLLLVAASCAHHRPLRLADPGPRDSLEAAIGESLAWLATRPPGETLSIGGRRLTVAQLAQGHRDFLALLATGGKSLPARIAERFELIEEAPVLVTGYYDAAIEGCREPFPGCDVPVYAPPPGMAGAAPDRHAIRAQGALAGQGLEIAWACDEIDLFFLEIQGSGTLLLPDGSLMRLDYAVGNGHPYRPIGRLLIDEGELARDEVSLATIRAWLDRHADQRRRVLDYNPSFVFFREGQGGALGSLGRPLVAGRSVAVDDRLFPMGALAWLTTEPPKGSGRPRLGRFVLLHDRGGAIKGPGRVDYFTGRGPEVERLAGAMRDPGRLLVLLPR